MKTKLICILTASILGAASSPGQPGAPVPAAQITGVVAQYLMNPNGQLDGLLLSDNTEVKFPPHMSADLARAVRPNDRVTAIGEREGPQTFRAFTIVNANGQTLNEARPSHTPPLPGARGANLQPMSVSGRIKALLHAPHGEVDGAVLDNGAILRIAPDAGAQVSALLQPGAAISARGFGTQNEFGRALQATEIGAAGPAPISSATPAPRP